jgi:hypothetical protein
MGKSLFYILACAVLGRGHEGGGRVLWWLDLEAFVLMDWRLERVQYHGGREGDRVDGEVGEEEVRVSVKVLLEGEEMTNKCWVWNRLCISYARKGRKA